MLDGELGELGAEHARRNVAPEARGVEHVGLVYRGNLSAPRHRELARDAANALDLGRRVLASVERGLRGTRTFAEIDASRQLADDEDVDALELLRLQRRSGGELGRGRDR